MGMGFSEILVLFLLSGTGGQDLLHFIPSDQYWKAHQTEVTVDNMLAELSAPASQPDISGLVAQLGDRAYKVRVEAHAKLKAMGKSIAPAIEKAMADPPNEEARLQMKELLAELTANPKPAAAIRLMAIRTLGELKDAKALPALRGLVESKAAFEAEYARAAIAAIDGKPMPRLAPPATQPGQLRNDIWLLRKNCGVVGQAIFPGDIKLDLDGIIADMMPPGGPEDAAAQAKIQIIQELMEIADRIGNIRLDGATFGVADDVGNNSGFVAIIARGQYDRAMVMAFLKEESRKGNNAFARMNFETVNGMDVISDGEGGNGYLILPSNDRAILVVGPSGERLPRKEMMAAIKTGKGGLADNADMVKLIKSVDPAANLWAVMKVSPAYAILPILMPFKELIAEAKINSDGVTFSLKARGAEADEVAKAVEMFNSGLKEANDGLAQAMQRMPSMKPVADLLESVKVKTDGANATVTAQFKGKITKLLGLPAMMWMRSSEGIRGRGAANPDAQLLN